MNNLAKNVGIWLVIALVLMTVFNQITSRQASQNTIAYSQFMDEVKDGHVKSAYIEGRSIRWKNADGKSFTTYSPGTDIWMVSDLLKYGVTVEAKPDEEQSMMLQIFISWFPMLLLIGVWVFFMRQMQMGGGKVRSPSVKAALCAGREFQHGNLCRRGRRGRGQGRSSRT